MKFLKKIKKFGFVLAVILVLVGSLMGYQIVQAVTGQGSANIDGGAPGGNATVDQSVSHKFTVVLTIGASGITTDASSPTFTIPTGFTAPTNPVANAGAVLADGDWFAIGGATCPITMSSSGTSGQVITIDVTTVCTVGAGGIITLTYQGQSATTMSAAPLVIKTAVDLGSGPATPITAPPTITVTASDIIPPTVTITMNDDVLNIGDTSLVTFTFSETPIEFDATDVNLTNANGTIGAIDYSNPLIQTAIFTPTNSIEDAINVITVGTAWTDAALNSGTGDDSPNYTIDTIAPTVISITFNDSNIIVGDTPLVTIIMSEPVASFTNTDVTTPNGTLGILSTSDNITFTGTFTPNTIEDSTNIAVVATTFTDTVGNSANAGASSANYTINTVVPVSVSGGSSGSIPVYGCKDPNATNYNYFSASNPALCVYANIPVVTPLLPNTGFPPRESNTWYEFLLNNILNLFK